MENEAPKKEMVTIPKAVARDVAAMIKQLPFGTFAPQSLQIVAFMIQQLESAPVIESEPEVTEGPEE